MSSLLPVRALASAVSATATQVASDAPEELIPAAAEDGLLGALLARPRLLAVVPPALRPQHFASDDRADLYAALQELGPQDGPAGIEVARMLGDTREARDLVTGLLGAVFSYLPADATRYAEHVIDAAQKRSVLAIGRQLRDSVITSGSAPAREAVALAIAAMEEAIGADAPTGETAWLDSALDEALAAADEAARNGKPAGLSTGYPSLDARLGGLEPGTLNILAGRPGSGKSSLGWQIALNVARSGGGVLVVSLEMSVRELGRRALAAASGVPVWRIKQGQFDARDGGELVRARRELAGLPLLIADRAGQTAGQIALQARTARRRLAKRGGLALILVDHMHIVAPDQADGRANNAQVFRRISGAMKRLAKDQACPVVLLAQLNRAVEGREDKRPHLSDLRESGSIEEDADTAAFVYRAETYHAKAPPERKDGESEMAHRERIAVWEERRRDLDGRAEVLFEKVRDGEPGMVELRFDKELTRFVDPAAEEPR